MATKRDEAAARKEMTRAIRCALINTDLAAEDAATAAGMSRGNWSNRMNRPDQFRLDELVGLASVMGKDQIRDIVVTYLAH